MTGEFVCPNCGDGYQRPAQHWAMSSTCSAPPIPTDARAVVTGLALAGASVYGGPGSENPKFRAVTRIRDRAAWWDDQLGWLSAGLRDYRPERDEDDRRDPGYQVTTHAHAGLSRFAWTRADGAPPLDLELSPLAVRAWLSHGAGVSFKPRPRFSFGARTSDARRHRLAALLRSLGCELDPTVTGEVVSLSVAETERLQEFAAPAPPGSEYKWARTRDEYRRLYPGEGGHDADQ